MADTFQDQIAHVARHAAPMAPRPTGGDDTAIIEDSCAKRIPLRPGKTYIYRGAGIDTAVPYLVGDGTVISVESSSGYVIDSNQLWGRTDVQGIRFIGGKGAIRNRFTGGNVAGQHRVSDCQFIDYTECAVSHNASDMPYWRIGGNEFRAKTDTGTIGVALSGLTDHSHITDNRFLNEQYSIKLRAGFANLLISGNDFIHFTGGGSQKRANLWLVPRGTDWQGNVDAGSGTVITANKFGGENQQTSDVRILIAGEGTGTTNGTMLPSLAKVGGYVNGVVFEHNNIGGMAEGVPFVVESWTPNVVSSIFGHNQFSGSFPAEFLHFSGDAPVQLAEVTIGPFTRQWNGAAQVMKAANVGLEHLWVETRNTTDPANLWPGGTPVDGGTVTIDSPNLFSQL